MKAVEAAQKVIEKFGTRDVLIITGKSSVKIVCENWYSVAAGEFDKKRRRFAKESARELLEFAA